MKTPGMMIAAASSGSGKTTFVCGLLEVLKRRNMKTASFKCGPDYIDPMFHRKVLCKDSINLDTFFTNQEETKELYNTYTSDCEIAVVEGVMGYYDGANMNQTESSSYELASRLKIPVILILNGKGMALTMVSILKGLKDFREDSNIVGVILNQVSRGVFLRLKPVIEEQVGMKALGCIPSIPECAFHQRHLGLYTPEEILDIKEKVHRIADVIEENVDIDECIRIAKNEAVKEEASETYVDDKVNIQNKRREGSGQEEAVIGVARDSAFCFYYEDNLNELRKRGAVIQYFSPLEDKKVPENCTGLLLGGGYPELFAKKLSENKSFLEDIKKKIKHGIPLLAECGGFLYLHDTMEDMEGKSYGMVGIVPGNAYYTGKLARFGYVILENDKWSIKAHEFHYYDSSNNGVDYLVRKPFGTIKYQAMHETKQWTIGFPHLYYRSQPAFTDEFIEKCRTYKNKI